MSVFQIIMPVYQTKSIFLSCIESLLKTVTQPTELIIINDGSAFDCQSLLQEIFQIPQEVQINYTTHATPMGYAKSVNQGLEYIRKDSYVVFADSDVIFTDNWQELVSDALADSSIGGVSGMLLYPQTGGIQCCGISYLNCLARHIYLNNSPSLLEMEDIYDVQASIFAFFATKSHVIQEIGSLDTNFYNGYEDIDYQIRIRNKGYRLVINSQIRLYHFEKSNGIHRQYLRKQNLGRFWVKHSNDVQDDMLHYLQNQLNKADLSADKYVLINMCESTWDAETVTTYLKAQLRISEVLDVSALCNVSNKLWLPELLSTDAYALSIPYVFLCDNFVELTENEYWFQLRSIYSTNDFIIDLYANVLPTSCLAKSFWPGNKIR